VILGNQQWPDVRACLDRIVDAVNSATPGSYSEVPIPHSQRTVGIVTVCMKCSFFIFSRTTDSLTVAARPEPAGLDLGILRRRSKCVRLMRRPFELIRD
jgi:hypothetical protein